MNIISSTLVILLAITSGVLFYLLDIATKKVEEWEDRFSLQQIRFKQLLDTVRFLDNKQMFEKDDEVGTLFIQIREAIEESERYIVYEEDPVEDETEEVS